MNVASLPSLRLVAGVLAAALQAAALAETVPVPDGFGIAPSRQLERVHAAERKGELPNTVSRDTLEQVCRASREMGATSRMPVFEPGHDQPASTRAWHFFSADGARRAGYTEITAYGCPEVKADGPCGCTYRRFVRHRVDINLWRDGRYQRWTAHLEDGTGTLDEGGTPSADFQFKPDEAVLTQLYGPVVGRASVAGWACAQRELPGASAPRRTCLALPDPKLPQMLWGRALSSSASGGPLAGGMRQSSELLRLVLAADVDTAVFTPPAGIPYRKRQRGVSPRDAQEFLP